MPAYEYKVVPAPRKAVKVKGIRSTEARFAHMIELVMNELGADGWEYLRTDTLPCDERQGLTGRSTSFQNMLVFRRVLGGEMVDAVAREHVAVMPEEVPARSKPVFQRKAVEAEGDEVLSLEFPGQRRSDEA
ncbi:MAG: DUF4177 domain-containing protein [Paracoccaceae bacterium]